MTTRNLPILATTRDVEALLGSSVSASEQARVSAWLRAISSNVRSYTKQTISKVTADTLQLWPYTPLADIWLPDLPIISVDAISPSIDNSWGFERMGRVYLQTGLWWQAARWPLSTNPLIITYTHGYDPIPDEIVDLIANKVSRLLIQRRANPENIRQESIGGYSMRFADTSEDVYLSKDEKEVLNVYRRKMYSMSFV